MNGMDFEQFVLTSGKDILRFCRMTAGSAECGDELYQDTMLTRLRSCPFSKNECMCKHGIHFSHFAQAVGEKA